MRIRIRKENSEIRMRKENSEIRMRKENNENWLRMKIARLEQKRENTFRAQKYIEVYKNTFLYI